MSTSKLYLADLSTAMAALDRSRADHESARSAVGRLFPRISRLTATRLEGLAVAEPDPYVSLQEAFGPTHLELPESWHERVKAALADANLERRHLRHALEGFTALAHKARILTVDADAARIYHSLECAYLPIPSGHPSLSSRVIAIRA